MRRCLLPATAAVARAAEDTLIPKVHVSLVGDVPDERWVYAGKVVLDVLLATRWFLRVEVNQVDLRLDNGRSRAGNPRRDCARLPLQCTTMTSRSNGLHPGRP